jgi:hypothetical protein
MGQHLKDLLPFIVVRSNVTYESVSLIKEILEQYGKTLAKMISK